MRMHSVPYCSSSRRQFHSTRMRRLSGLTMHSTTKLDSPNSSYVVIYIVSLHPFVEYSPSTTSSRNASTRPLLFYAKYSLLFARSYIALIITDFRIDIYIEYGSRRSVPCKQTRQWHACEGKSEDHDMMVLFETDVFFVSYVQKTTAEFTVDRYDKLDWMFITSQLKPNWPCGDGEVLKSTNR